MSTVSIRDAKNRLTELARRVELGETIVVTRNGKPIIDLVPHSRDAGARLEAIEEFKRKQGVERIVTFVSDDFDAPLPEDFLIVGGGQSVRLLLDTQVFIGLLDRHPDRLGGKLEAALSSPESTFFISVASLWEIAIKTRSGKLQLSVGIELLPEIIQAMHFGLLPILAWHVLTKADPEPPTRDPLDRLLLAQCTVERLRLVTLDRALATHPLAFEGG
jgi:prevent-host-death family protein